jgi:hypothetical protein
MGCRLAPHVHPLLAEPTSEQRQLLQVIYRGRTLASSATERRWPIFQYVEQQLSLEHGVDAMDTIASSPPLGGFGGAYGWTWSGRNQPEDEVGLTVAGMMHVADAEREVALFLDVLTVLVSDQRSFEPSPTEVVVVQVSASELRDCLRPHWRLDAASLANIRDILSHEPATWHCQATPEDDWTLTLSPFLRRFAGLDTQETYLERVIEIMGSAGAEPEPLFPSPLSLPEAIDYLNAIWRLQTGHALIRIGRAEAAAKLVLDCSGSDEFDSRLSALCSILDSMQVPDQPASKLVNLRAYLQGELAEDSAARATVAVDDLRALFDLRVWRQHAGTETRAALGMERLGISLPVVDWGHAWLLVRARAVAALSAIREEVETLAA